MNEDQKKAIGCFALIAIIIVVWIVQKVPEKDPQKVEDAKPQTNYSVALSNANSALSAMNIQGTYTTEFKGDRLVIVITLSSPPTNARSYAENVFLSVRNRIVSSGAGVKSYRVSLHGPSPGPGLVRVYGAYRFTEGFKGEWSEN